MKPFFLGRSIPRPPPTGSESPRASLRAGCLAAASLVAAFLASQAEAQEPFDENLVLSPEVTIVRGARVQGPGGAYLDELRAGVRRIHSAIARCGEVHPAEGIVALSFRLRRGRPAPASQIEITGGTDELRRCLRRAARRIRVQGGSYGGPARYEYVLRFRRAGE
ncbi:MAG: hypothetical protein AAGE52_38635 [Myxococcota bacterium]